MGIPVRDTCGNCQVDYDITAGNGEMYLYLEDSVANHIWAKCPNGHEERIFLIPERIVDFYMDFGTVKIYFYPRASEELRQTAIRAWNAGRANSEPDPPPHMLRELFDTMREFGGES